MEFTFGDPYLVRFVDRSRERLTYPVALIGAKTHQRIQLGLQGHIETFTVIFQPTALHRLFSLPAGLLVNEDYEADAVLNLRFASLRAELGEARSFAKQVVIADRFFRRLIPQMNDQPRLEAVVNRMISQRGCVRVQELTDGMGLGLRQFERLFTSHLGIGPKTYARILRFEAAIYWKSVSSYNWTRIAHDLGYFDQMHMIHDFQALSGDSPKQLTKHFEILSSISADSRV
jgi:AraC-like DNA-binding protein